MEKPFHNVFNLSNNRCCLLLEDTEQHRQHETPPDEFTYEKYLSIVRSANGWLDEYKVRKYKTRREQQWCSG